jgi:ribonuclease J
MKANVQIAQNLGFIKKHEGTLLPIEELSKYKDNKVIILTTGAQGESNAGLMKIVNGEHRFVGIKPGDTVVFSSSVIAGNERNVQILQDNLSRQGAIVYNSAIMDIHSSGHAPKNDLQMVMKTMKPRFLLPVHGYYFMRAANCQSGREVGIPKENLILMDNGQVAEMSEQKITITQEQIPSFYIMVDGLGVGDVEEVVLRDRRMLAAEGMVVIILILRRENGRLAKNPDIISRGFIHLKENQEVLQEIRKKTVGAIDRLPQNKELELDYVRGLIRDQIGAFIFNKTKRRPMIIPVIIEV